MKRMRSLNNRTDLRSSGRIHRRGTVIIIAMVILLILMAISSTLIGSVIQTRTQFIREEQSLQTSLLVEAGLRRGVLLRQKDGTYQGETWQIAADHAAGLDPGQVVIIVSESKEKNGELVISATAEYPAGTPNPIRITRDLPISLQTSP